MLKLIIETVTR